MRILLAVVFFLSSSFGAGFLLQDLDYADHRETFYRPDCGFYVPQVLHLKPEGTSPITKPYGRFLHLRAELSAFSSRAPIAVNGSDTTWGTSGPLTESALDALRETFQSIRQNGGTVIVRFCYDPWYNGISNTGPAQSVVLGHVLQLAQVLSEYADVITALEMGMYGAYGEMHSDTSITYERVAESINLMLRNTPPELKIVTRTPKYAASVLGIENRGVDFNIESPAFLKMAAAKGDTLYRLGIFNDGYLGTQYDYGTWDASCETGICREEGVAWLEKYGVNTPYGGEALTTASGYDTINTPEFLSYEGFRTHTSYLNIQWNDKLIGSWKNVQFQKTDFEYDSTVTGFKYIEDHLGYRFVLRKSEVMDSVSVGGNFQAALQIQNVGFGNLTRSVQTSLVLKDDSGNVQSLPLSDVDFQAVHGRTVSVSGGDTTLSFDGTNDLTLNVRLPEGLSPGRYAAYLKVASENDSLSIRFANDSAQYDSSLRGNLIGNFVLTEKELAVLPGVQKAGRGYAPRKGVWFDALGKRERGSRGAKKMFQNP